MDSPDKNPARSGLSASLAVLYWPKYDRTLTISTKKGGYKVLEENDRTEEVFRGHLEECFEHLKNRFEARWPKGSKGAERARKPLADFCGVTPKTFAGWSVGRSKPIAEQLIKLMVYLDMIGYRVIELEKLKKKSPGPRAYVDLVGFSLISLKEAADLLGYANASVLSQVLQGHSGTSEEREQKMWEIWTERRDELITRKAQALEQYQLDLPGRIQSKEERPLVAYMRTGEIPKPAEPKAKPSMKPAVRRQKAVVGLMDSLLVLLEENPFGDGALGELSGLDGPGEDAVFALFDQFADLSQRIIASKRKGG